MTEKFREGQQVWVCFVRLGQLVREKGIILSANENGVTAGSFPTSTKFSLDSDGRGENVWLEPRL